MPPISAIQRRPPAACSRGGGAYETGRRIVALHSGVAGLFGKWRRLALRQRDLEHVQHISDQRVIADDRDELDDALFAERAHRLTEALVGQPLRPEDLIADAVDKRLVLIGEHRCAAGADHLDRYRRHAGFLGKRRVRIPLVLRRQNRAVVMIANSDNPSGSDVPQRTCPASLDAYSQITGDLIRIWKGPPKR